MKYYSKEIQKEGYIYQTAGVKARDDIEEILKGEDFKELLIPTLGNDRREASKLKKLLAHFRIRKVWKSKTAAMTKGDLLFVQYPTIEHSIFLLSVFKNLRKKGIKLIFLIHDLEYIRLAVSENKEMTRAKSRRLHLEQQALHFGNKIIVHNKPMLDKMVELGFDKRKLISLDLFDYLIPDYNNDKLRDRKNRRDMPVIIAGNLKRQKAEYVYSLPDNVEFNLYGVNYEDVGKKNIHYQGSFMPDELPYSLNGSFGLVWDGTSADSCSGVFGEYLRINNPHKTSLYLASGIPVIIWKEAALADLILKNKVGIAIDSLYNIPEALDKISDEEYSILKRNALTLSEKLRNGGFTKDALAKYGV